jgi:dipeptide/tripeptide permease
MAPVARRISMKKLLGFIGSTIGSYAGWYVGAPIGFMTAFTLSMVGMGVGIYAAVKVAQRYE